jgi:hypothetical protein
VRVRLAYLVHRQRLEIGALSRFPPFPDVRHLTPRRVHGFSLTTWFSRWFVLGICSAGALSGPASSRPSSRPGRSRHNFCTVRYRTVRYNGLVCLY